MKKIIIILAIAALFGCTKEKNCNCGIVVGDNVKNQIFYLDVKNNCSKNKRTFQVDEKEWMDAHIGSEVCFTNSNSW